MNNRSRVSEEERREAFKVIREFNYYWTHPERRMHMSEDLAASFRKIWEKGFVDLCEESLAWLKATFQSWK